MSVVIETTLGDITVDLYLKQRPRCCLNFLKLCKMKYYNFNLFHMINRGFIAQTGDPTGSGEGGESIWGVIDGLEKRYFEAETNPRIKHTMAGLISFVGDKENMLGSQFFITMSPELTYLDAQHCVFGEVVEGLDILHLLNEAICDGDHRPYQDVRITHTVILEDPFPDPEGFTAPDSSPEPTAERLKGGRIAPDEDIDETIGKSAQEIAEMIAEREAKARATILEMVGDIPDAEMAPPENVLFVCKLNPVTNDDDLEIIFSRFGKIKSCEVIRDKKTGDSLQYAFVEFENEKSCEDAYFKMDNVLIDDRRIHVDFSQSVAKVRWHGKGRITYYNDDGEKGDPNIDFGSGKYQKNTKYNDKGNNYKDEKKNDKNKDDYKKYDKPKNYKVEKERSDRRFEAKDRRNRSRTPERYRRRDEVQKNGRNQREEYNKTERKYDRREEYKRSDKNDERRRSRSRENNDRRKRSESRENRGKKRRSRSPEYNRRTERSREYSNSRRVESRDYIKKTETKRERSRSRDKNRKPVNRSATKEESRKEKPSEKSKKRKIDNSEKVKRKKKPETSDSSESEEEVKKKKKSRRSKKEESSSSSSEEEVKKKIKKKQRKRRESTSSESSSSSSSSTSTSSSSSSDHKTRRKKDKKKKKR